MGKPTFIFLPPPLTSTYFTYQNVNADPKLRKSVTDHFFYLINQINKEKTTNKILSFNKKQKQILSTDKGYELIYQILRRYTKKYNFNWYDLRSIEDDILYYINIKVNRIIKL